VHVPPPVAIGLAVTELEIEVRVAVRRARARIDELAHGLAEHRLKRRVDKPVGVERVVVAHVPGLPLQRRRLLEDGEHRVAHVRGLRGGEGRRLGPGAFSARRGAAGGEGSERAAGERERANPNCE